ncbi:hypothetical protein BMI86_10100 [Thioclava sp. DLFJ5-1]|uniref:hypothetical protein n=1 Tax=Thioclava sp. DLFJ5-1 TaxID=1915314 RepID=UPI0009967225|nr:hypothetical protein [Thioclava sp. DLFJ5-1]OOY20849.1 hypothetical protein BMI86_10100 [Thioclava sp. DLFJ5-1]
MIIAGKGTYLGFLSEIIDQMRPGDELLIDGNAMRRQLEPSAGRGKPFSPADRVLSNICGPLVFHTYEVSHATGKVMFRCHAIDRRHGSPDKTLKGIFDA